jgi:hypothetical protein
MVHPDYQYDPTCIPDLIAPIVAGEVDMMVGSRFLGDPLAGGMPRWKFLANRFLTGMENRVFGLKLSEYHSGFRAYSRRLLETIDYHANSDDFVFDQEFVAQVVAAGFRIGEVPVPTRYFAEASSVNLRRSVVYGVGTLYTLARYRRAARLAAAEAAGAAQGSRRVRRAGGVAPRVGPAGRPACRPCRSPGVSALPVADRRLSAGRQRGAAEQRRPRGRRARGQLPAAAGDQPQAQPAR